MGDLRISLHVLRVLQVLYQRLDDPHYGLELQRALNISNGALYPILDKLERAGYVKSQLEDLDEVAAGRRKRRYFQLTATGIPFAEEHLRTTLATLGQGVHS
ncbi:PadR family transcriptional regulator [Deinococcus aquatilis]|uniref:PadR family transcriptional regulator n=1 Tax=Deinococcus aquatilis TaxID=519440 RepID=UPI00037E3ED7|nr:PadR family transcriptional regulator [Deinococcus aquatilis]